MRRDRLQQLARDLVRISVEKPNPAQILDSGKFFEQQSQAVLQAEVFAVTRSVLADQGNFANAGLGQPFGLGNDRLEAARPELELLSFKATAAQKDGTLPISLGAKDDILLEGKLTFVVQTKDAFPRTQTIEVATADGSLHTTLSLATNNLVLQDEHTAVATLDPMKAFGQSAFGKLQMRPVAADGTPGNWTPLGILVRAPQITAIHCTSADTPTCTVEGSNLFLVQSFGATKDFARLADVPTGFAENNFTVPTPADGATLYLKLRDDPSAVATVTLLTPVQESTSSATPPTSGQPQDQN